MTILATIVPLLVACETSNQSYSQNSRVVDLTQQQNSSNKAPRPVPPAYVNNANTNKNPAPTKQPGSSIQDEAVYEENQSANSNQVNASSSIANNPASSAEVIDYSSPNYNQNKPSYNQGNSNYNQNTPSYNQGNPSYNQGNQIYNQPNYNQGNSNYNQNIPSYNQGNLSYNQGNQSYNQPNYNQGSPNYNQGNQAYNQPSYNQGYNQPSYNQGYNQSSYNQGTTSYTQGNLVNNNGYNQNYNNSSSAPAYPAQEPSQSNGPSTASGNWLVLDSEAAKQDITNTKAEQEALLAKQDSSTQTIYQNSIATTAGPDRYRVVQGDTLYSIAFRYGLDYHSLAELNKIEPPYNLAVGQILTLNLKASKSPEYIVQSGDTLYSIAKKYGQSVSFLAGVNNLEPPYNLTKGQKLKLSRDGATTDIRNPEKDNMEVPVAGKEQVIASNNNNSSNKQNETQVQKPATVPPVAQTPIIKTKTREVAGVTWSWPTTGRVIEQFSTAEQGNKGIDIEGKRGQAILSAADGQVVYSGSALRGFGNLIIINHSNEYLSAYAHNETLLVKEGQKVKRGQQIAKMGNTDASSVRLHFEIRYRGQSVNPVSYLPK